MSYIINNNALEVDPSPRKKRKRSLQCTNAYMNPALDILCNEDSMCNNLMEIAPSKRTRRSRSCDSRVIFENPAMDLGNNRSDINDLLRKELANVNRKLTSITELRSPIYQNDDTFNDVLIEEKILTHYRPPNQNAMQVNSTPVVNGSTVLKRRASFDLSFIEKLEIDDNVNGEALYLDDDLNESNIMEIKTITLVTNRKVKHDEKPLRKNTNPFLNSPINYDAIEMAPETIEKSNNFPFDLPIQNPNTAQNESITTISSYDATYKSSEPESESITSAENIVVPRRLFVDDNSIQYIDEPSISSEHKKFGHSTLNEPINYNFANTSNKNKPLFVFGSENINKQSKILGCDVTNMSENDIYNCRNNTINSNKVFIPNTSNNIQATFKDNSQRMDIAKKQGKSNKTISTKIFSKIKDVFKHEKKVPKNDPPSGNPYEVIRKATVVEKSKKPPPACFVNPALNLNTTDVECEEIDSDIDDGTISNFNKNPFQITPMKRCQENMLYGKENLYSTQNSALSNYIDLSSASNQSENLPKKQVRFDSTLNHEKLITGNSFDSESNSLASNSSSSGSNSNQVTQVFHHIDSQIDEFHNELENCFNEKKIISQNL